MARAKSPTLQRLLLGMAVLPLLSGCVAKFPVDPEGTLQEVRSGTISVGVTPNANFVEVADEELQGSEIQVIKDFAESLDAEVEWTVAGEEQLVAALQDGDLDLVAGGISSKTPWSEKVGMTRPYTTQIDADGQESKIVMLVPPGENAFLFEAERFLDRTQEKP